MKNKKALLIVDVQNDFCPGGSLAVPEGDAVVPVLNRYARIFSKRELPIFASRDWHPLQTKHFKNFGGIWPRHCVQETSGARFHPALDLPPETVVISKGMDFAQDSYSAFQGEDGDGRSLADILRESGVRALFIGGLATDYCVKSSCLDGVAHGFKVFLLADAIRGVDVKPGDSQSAIVEMSENGVQSVSQLEVEGLLSHE